MGATNFTYKYEGTDPRSAFDALVSELVYEYGNDSYNGTASTCSYSGRCLSTRDLCRKAGISENAPAKERVKAAYDYADKALDDASKWYADAVDCGITKWVVSKTKITKAVPRDAVAPKYATRWVVTDFNGTPISRSAVKETFSAAKAYAMDHVDERPARIERRKVLVSGSEPTYSITYEDKTYDRKPARVPKGATLKAIHTYVFYGWAAC